MNLKMVKKFIWISIVLLVIMGCGSRKKDLSKTNDQSKFESNSSLNQNVSSSNNTSSITDVRSFLISNGLKIKSNGQNYEFKYGDLSFSGSADVDFSQKKEETVTHHMNQVHTIYTTKTNYQTKTYYQTKKRSENVSIKRSGISFGSMVWVVLSSLIVGAMVWEIIKRLIFK
ncbi:hypothetical protein CLU96_1226 [Chryseobacterium sp. 52]|uniref:hypothetical protein n=1 Tax=Chryseobacterium sp. 52 TaxID=2035213 RepID=UPI000C46FBCD|nr:hypothetical protein [Chryseobacterium sp. 52]PIF44285.1 hypothetical protein CLU96_1226 [Chryseobacterium sp. 52]